MEVSSPYRFFFPLGILYAMGGLLAWILFWLQRMPYPGALHADWMMLGFVGNFATGFLMTAVPKFLNAPPCRLWELIVGLAFGTLPFINTALAYQGHVLLLAAPYLFLLLFISIRFCRRSFSPPISFIFVPIGVFLGILGSLSRPLLYEGVVLAFLFGIGSRLIPALTGVGGPVLVQIETRSPFWRRKENFYFIDAGLFTIGGILHGFQYTLIADSIWAAVGLSLALRVWKIHRRPVHKGVLPSWIRVSSISLIAGLLLNVAFFQHRLHLVHIVYVLGVFLMTLLVATRVVLAHGGHDMQLETRSKGLLVIGILSLLAGLTRASVGWISADLYFSHLAYAATLLLTALIIWSVILLPKIVRSSK